MAPRPVFHWPLLWLSTLACWGLIAACTPDSPAPPAEAIIEQALAAHGSAALNPAVVTFDFRDAHFRIRHAGGRYHYQRTYRDSLGRAVREVLSNDSLYRAVDGERVTLTEDERRSVESAVNSVTYFALLPYFLQDAAVQPDYLGVDTVAGAPYDQVRVTFRQEGGGRDWQDVFMYWFDPSDHTMEYLAYAYGFGPDEAYGTRFREAYNARTVEDIRFADYRNYTTVGDTLRDLTRYPALMAQDSLELVSRVELDSVRVRPLDS